MSVHLFGTQVSDMDVKCRHFYHGISQKLAFSKYLGHLKIYCPLSTSLSFPVAVNFSNNNAGLVVNLTAGEKNGSSSWGYEAKCFSVSWLSNYANEQEHLFIQNTHVLLIYDVVDSHFGYGYRIILQALRNIGHLMVNKDAWTQKYNSPFEHDKNVPFALMNRIISDQASTKIHGYAAFETLDEYGKVMCDTYFESIIAIKPSYRHVSETYSKKEANVFFDNNECIKLQLINSIFPNMEKITMLDCVLSTILLDNIVVFVDYLKKNSKLKSKLRVIELLSLRNIGPTLLLKELIHEYALEFRKLNCYIAFDLWNKKIVICFDIIEFCFCMIENMYAMYFEDVNDEITKLMKQLIAAQLSQKQIQRNNEQTLFRKRCMEKESVTVIECDLIASNPNTLVQKLFYDSQHIQININNIALLFPNVLQFTVSGIPWSAVPVEDILKIFENDQHKLEYIAFWMLKKEANDNVRIVEMMNKHQRNFKIIGSRMYTTTSVLNFKRHTSSSWYV
eukprot:277785_1